MPSKGTRFSRTMAYFREVDLAEAQAALGAAASIVDERDRAGSKPKPVVRRRRAVPLGEVPPPAVVSASD